MWKRDYLNDVHILPGFAPVVVTDNTAQVTAIINVADYDGLVFALQTGTLSDADATSAILVEHGNDSGLSDAAAVPDDMLNGPHATLTPEQAAAFTFSDDGETRKIGYRGDKQYVRLTFTPSGNTGNIPVSCMALLFGPRRKPTANPPT